MSSISVLGIGIVLTTVFVIRVIVVMCREHRCKKKGHDWKYTMYGVKCHRCKIEVNEEDQ